MAEKVRFAVLHIPPDAEPEPEPEDPEPPVVPPLLEPLPEEPLPEDPLPEVPFWSAAPPDADADADAEPATPASLGLQAVRDRPAAATTRARTESFLLLRIASP
ncbi:hypothetical protein [Streptomyces sp. NPDC006012]|uniref:hypothetical protein n=1 Tax=Streptomyces sp. NPDC006012 TaxID=3364739 RepID=UPI003696EA51